MGTIPSQTIEQIAAANDIVEVIGTYFPLKRAGSTFKAICPFHQEKTPSFTVSPSRQTFHCFGCGAGGSVFRFVMDYEHLEFPAAVKKLAARVGIPVIEERGSSPAEEDRQHEARRALLQLHAEAAEWFHENLVKKKVGEPARGYLKGRGIDKRIAKDWQIGFAPESWDAFLSWALERGYQQRLLLESGLIARREEGASDSKGYDRFRNRIMFPIHNDVGEVIAFSGRILDKEAEAAKYVNSPETPLFRKGRVLFGLHKTKRALIEENCAIVCEGQLDLITVFEAGITNVVAPQGTAFTEQQARILKRFVSEVVLCFDSDPAGQKAGERSLATFVESFGLQSSKLQNRGEGARGRGPAERSLDSFLQHDLVVRVAVMPPGEDPDSIIRKQGADAFKQRIAEAPNFFDYWINRETAAADLGSVAAKMQLARKLAEPLSHVRDGVIRSELANKICARIGVSPRDFAQLLAKPTRERFSVDDGETRREVTAPPRHEIAMLCLLALRHDEARQFLLSQDWREMLAHTPDSQMLVRILESDLHPDDPASLNAFMAGLAPGEEALVSGWLLQKMPPNGLEVAQGFWNGLREAVLRRQLQIAQGRLQLPRIGAGEEIALQKQILDLTEQLRDLSAFSSARVLDS
jgi:DNA primase